MIMSIFCVSFIFSLVRHWAVHNAATLETHEERKLLSVVRISNVILTSVVVGIDLAVPTNDDGFVYEFLTEANDLQ